MKPRVSVVDDEQDIRELLKFYLNKEGYEVIEAANGEEALTIFENEYIDLGIIDVMMPKMDGFELVESMKEFKDVPCIMLTAKGESKDKLRGFSSGVDDYVVKHIVRLNEVELDGDKYEIRYKDECIHLPLKQFELLFELAKHPNQIFSREQLIEKIWGMDYDGFDRTVDVHIKRIRENIGHLPGFNVVTVRGLGYKVEVE